MTIRKNQAYTITFAAVDPAARPSRKTGLGFGAGDSVISQDGGGFANTTNSPSELNFPGPVASGRYSLALTAAEMDADNIHLVFKAAGMDEADYLLQTSGEETAQVVADGGNTALTFKTDRTEAIDNYWQDALLLFTSGSLVGQVKKITGYNGTTKFVTVGTGFTGTPAVTDRFVLVNL
jgi:hypothetical protein